MTNLTFFTLTICFLACFFCSCNHPKCLINDDYQLEISNTYELMLPDETGDNFMAEVAYYNADTLKIALYSQKLHKIYLYNLETANLTKIIQLKSEGPDKIDKMHNNLVVINDSLFMTFCACKVAATVFNANGKIVTKYPANEIIIDQTALNNSLIFNTEENCVYFVGEQEGAIENHYLQRKHILKMDLNTGHIVNSYTEYPENVKLAFADDQFFEQREYFSFVIVDQKLVVSFASNDNLYVYDIKTANLLKTIPAKSCYIEKMNPIIADASWQQKVNSLITEPQYTKLHYDSTNQLYYRIVKHRQELLQNTEEANNLFSSKVSVMVFDKTLNLLNEQTLNYKKFNFYATKAVKDGLLVRTISTDEMKIRFDYLTIQKSKTR